MRAAAAAVIALISVLASALRGRFSGHGLHPPDSAGSGSAGRSASRAGGVPWWGVIAAAASPVLLVAGWTAAAELQPRSYDVLTTTVSALAAEGSADRWVMTLTFAVAGACEVITGLALAGRGTGAADPDGRRYRGRAGRGEPAARRGLASACGLGGGRSLRPDGVAGCSVAAGADGAVGTAASCFGQRRRDTSRPACMVLRGAGRGRRPGGPGGASHGRGAGVLAAGGDPVLPP